MPSRLAALNTDPNDFTFLIQSPRRLSNAAGMPPRAARFCCRNAGARPPGGEHFFLRVPAAAAETVTPWLPDPGAPPALPPAGTRRLLYTRPQGMQPGELVADRFEVESRASAGGMGAVFRAQDRMTGAVVALKV